MAASRHAFGLETAQRKSRTIEGFSADLGKDIDDIAGGVQFGARVSISDDGTRVAIGAPWNDGVRIYELTDASWNQLGSDIDGGTAGDEFGSSVSFNADGTYIAIGAEKAGYVRVYQGDDGSDWTQLGGDINSNSSGDDFGYAVSLSDTGTRVAIGAPNSDGDGTGNLAGLVQVYELAGDNWTQIGNDVSGTVAESRFGASVSLSASGTRLAIGAPAYDVGTVRVYDDQEFKIIAQH